MKESALEYKLKNTGAAVRPFIYERPSVSSVCIKILILLFIQILMLFVTKSFSALCVIGVSLLGAIGAAILNYRINNEEKYHAYTTIIQGIMIGMLLPQTFPLIPVFVISFLCLFVSRVNIFRSINSWINAAALAVIIGWFIGNSFFPDFLVTNDIIPLKNPSLYLIQNHTFPIYEFDSSVTSFLNSYVFKYFKVSIPEGYVSLLWDTNSIIPAFRFNLLTIISSIVLFSDNSFSGIIPTTFLIVFGVLVRLFVPALFGGTMNQGDIILAFLTSGTLFCVVFMIQWYGTTPLSIPGKIVFGVFAGLLAFITSGCGTSPIGMVYTVLISNIISLMIRVLEEINNRAVVARNNAKYLSTGGDKVK